LYRLQARDTVALGRGGPSVPGPCLGYNLQKGNPTASANRRRPSKQAETDVHREGTHLLRAGSSTPGPLGPPRATDMPMHDVRLTLADAPATQVLGEALGRVAHPGDILWLEGDLGAGKTTLVQGLGRALDVAGAVTSPTFALVQEHEGRLLLRHIDLYRLEPEEVPPLGPWEWFEDTAVVVVEWPDRLSDAFTPDVAGRLVIEGGARAVRLRACTSRGAAWLDEAGLVA